MKWLGWFGKMVVSAALISFLSVGTTAYLVDQYVKSILDRLQLTGVKRPSVHWGDWLSSLTSMNLNPNLNNQNSNPLLPKDAVETVETEQSKEAGNASEAEQASETDQVSEAEQDLDTSIPVFGQSAAMDSLVMSAEEFNEKRKKLTDQDQLEIFTIMMNKLPQNELQKMSELLEDGITEEELNQLEDVINAYLHKEDVARLLSILNKY